MSEPFDILLASSRPKRQSQQLNQPSLYLRMQSDFLNNHLGYYTLHFIRIISQEATHLIPDAKVLGLQKMIRGMVKQLMLSDLELVYVGCISKICGWRVTDPFITNNCYILNYNCDLLPRNSQYLMFFINLVGYFVKKYVGTIEECRVLAQSMRKETGGLWEGVYEQWLRQCPRQMFRLSPREVNEVYSRYARHCQQLSQAKNYNSMVDQIMELSTSYAMIPGESKQNKKRKKGSQEQKQNIQSNQAHLFGKKVVKLDGQSNILHPGTVSRLLDFNISSLHSNSFIDQAHCSNPKRSIKLGFKGSQQTRVNKHVTDMLKQSPKDLSVGLKHVPQSMIGIVDPNPNFFDSKMFSSGEEIIPYTLRSNSNVFRSKLFE